jgi:hypothetical protein
MRQKEGVSVQLYEDLSGVVVRYFVVEKGRALVMEVRISMSGRKFDPKMDVCLDIHEREWKVFEGYPCDYFNKCNLHGIYNNELKASLLDCLKRKGQGEMLKLLRHALREYK